MKETKSGKDLLTQSCVISSYVLLNLEIITHQHATRYRLCTFLRFPVWFHHDPNPTKSRESLCPPDRVPKTFHALRYAKKKQNKN